MRPRGPHPRKARGLDLVEARAREIVAGDLAGITAAFADSMEVS
jgi:hypothetical protein